MQYTIFQIINDDVRDITQQINKTPSDKLYIDGYTDAFEKAVFDWLPKAKCSDNIIDEFMSEKNDMLRWTKHRSDTDKFKDKTYLDGFNNGAETVKQLIADILHLKIVYIVEGDHDTDLEGMTFAVCSTKELAVGAMNALFDGEDLRITEMFSDTIITDKDIIRIADNTVLSSH